jgi:hypothetical protein
MMKTHKLVLLSALLTVSLAVLSPVSAHAQLKITEIQASEVGSGHGDWFELSNFGASPITMTGYKFDDNSTNITLAVTLPTITLAAGESAVFAESTTFAAFTNWWGITAPIQVDIYAGSGVSLGAGGDQVNIWDGSGNLVDYAWFNSATSGHTFDQFDPITHLATHESVNGVNDAFTSADGNIGSPGLVAVVPEPSSFALAAVGLGALLKFRNRRK